MEKESQSTAQDTPKQTQQNLENLESTEQPLQGEQAADAVDAAEVQHDIEQKEREAILNEQVKRLHPDQPLATVHLNSSKGQGTATAVQPQTESAGRRKNRIAYICAAIIMTAVVLVLIVSAVQAVGGDGINHSLAGSAGSADISHSGSPADVQQEPAEEEPQPPAEQKPASQQESEQYLQIKDDTTLPAYALQYPGMYSDAVSEPNVETIGKKACYLTFDDGPSSTNTPGILDTLKAYNVKATFFVVTSEIDGNEALIQRIVNEGHTLCIHADKHVYGDLYGSVDDYLADFAAAYDKIYDITGGYRVQGLRFPGGSNNVVMARHGTYHDIVQEMTRRGFEYYDWNAYDHDAEGKDYTVDQMVNFATNEVYNTTRNDAIILMHDTYGKEKTVLALPRIIEQLQNAGAEFMPISGSTRPVHFYVDELTPPDMPVQETTADTSSESTES